MDSVPGAQTADPATVDQVPLVVVPARSPAGAASAPGTPSTPAATSTPSAPSATPGPTATPVEPSTTTALVADGESAAAPGRVQTAPIDVSGTDSLGVTWPSTADGDRLDTQVRTLAGGHWSSWSALDSDIAPDAGTADARRERGGTEPLWVADADAVQLSFAAGKDGGPAGMKLALVKSDGSGAAVAGSAANLGALAVQPAAARSAGTRVAAAGVTAPTVISRTAWGARAPACTPDVATTLVGAAVHHTADPNDYTTVAQAMARIRADQAYHIDGRGWCDIGYNFVVDKWGNIYEGRANSLTEPVIGVHAGGFNTGTVGVAMLGTYDSAPSAATVSSVARIIGWRLGYYGVDPTGTMRYTTGVGENSRFKNQTVTLPRVFGHRDVAYTDCPGAGGYAALPSIRSQAKAVSSAVVFQNARAVVSALYQDLLRRGADPGGLATYTNLAVTSQGIAPVVTRLTTSAEYARIRVKAAYQAVLGRDADPSGLQTYVDAVAAGRIAPDDVVVSLARSAEFRNRFGGTDAGFVAGLYRAFLGRAASSTDIEFWTGLMQSYGEAGVAARVWGSAESARNRVSVDYDVLLHRGADASGLSTYTTLLRSRGEDAVRQVLAGSAEYLGKAIAAYGTAATAASTA